MNCDTRFCNRYEQSTCATGQLKNLSLKAVKEPRKEVPVSRVFLEPIVVPFGYKSFVVLILHSTYLPAIRFT